MPSLSSLIESASTKYGVDQNLATAVARAESGLNPEIGLSPKGAIGPFQLMPKTAAGMNVNPYDLKQNVDGGVRYLREMQEASGRWVDGELVEVNNAEALARYNWGPANVDSYLKKGVGIYGQPMPAETLNYAHQVLTEIGDQEGLKSLQELANRSPKAAATYATTLQDRAKGTSGHPQGALANPTPNDVKIDASQVRRDKDTIPSTMPESWGSPVDPHTSYFASAEIKIGDVVVCPLAPEGRNSSMIGPALTGDSEGTDVRLQEFQYRSMTQSGNMVLFRLFAKSWEDVVQISSLAAQAENCQIRYGYTNIPDGLVGPLNVKILSITPEFLENGYSISVEGIDRGAADNLQHGSKVYTWGSQSGRVSDIAFAIGVGNKWKTCIEPTVATDPQIRYTQSQQSDLNFLNTTLSRVARTATPRPDGSAGPYVAYLTYDHNDFEHPTLHFHPRLPAPNTEAAKAQREYVWGGVHDPSKREFGTVIKFSPSFDPAGYLMLGGDRLESAAMDVDKKVLHKVLCKGSDCVDKGLGGKTGPVTVKMSSEKPSRALTFVEHELEFILARSAARFFVLREFSINASLVVLGDPYVRGGIIVNVLVMRPNDGAIMFYDWFVTEAIHTITGGEYTLSMELIRTPAGPVSTDSSLPGLGAGIPQYSQKASVDSESHGLVVGKNFEK